MNAASHDRIRQDRRLIGQTLLKLAMPRLIVRGVVLIVAAIIWLMVASWLLDFGRGLSFEGLQAFGQQAIDLLTRINPYLWWGVVVIWTLIVFFGARAWLLSDVAATRAKPVAPSDLSALTAQLSDEVANVLRWVWSNRDEPFTLGDLRQAAIELRHSRIDKIELVREQSRILDGQRAIDPRTASPARPHSDSPATPAQAAVLTTPAEKNRPTQSRIEPNL